MQTQLPSQSDNIQIDFLIHIPSARNSVTLPPVSPVQHDLLKPFQRLVLHTLNLRKEWKKAVSLARYLKQGIDASVEKQQDQQGSLDQALVAVKGLKQELLIAKEALTRMSQTLRHSGLEIQNLIKTIKTYKPTESVNSKYESKNSISHESSLENESFGQFVKHSTPHISTLNNILQPAITLEAEISKVITRTAATDEEQESLHESARVLGRDSSFSSAKVAQTMGLLGNKNFSVQELISASTASVQLAQVDDSAGLNTAADILTTAVDGFAAGAEAIGHYSDVLARTANSSSTTVVDLGNIIADITDTVNPKELGLNFEKTAAIVGQLSDSGFSSREASKVLGHFLNAPADMESRRKLEQYAGPVDTQTPLETLRKLAENLDVDKDRSAVEKIFATGNYEQLQKFLQSVQNGGLNQQIAISQGDKNNSTLTDKQGIYAGHTAKSIVDARSDNVQGAYTRMQSTTEDIAIRNATAVLPLVQGVTDFSSNMLNSMPAPLALGTVLSGGLGLDKMTSNLTRLFADKIPENSTSGMYGDGPIPVYMVNADEIECNCVNIDLSIGLGGGRRTPKPKTPKPRPKDKKKGGQTRNKDKDNDKEKKKDKKRKKYKKRKRQESKRDNDNKKTDKQKKKTNKPKPGRARLPVPVEQKKKKKQSKKKQSTAKKNSVTTKTVSTSKSAATSVTKAPAPKASSSSLSSIAGKTLTRATGVLQVGVAAKNISDILNDDTLSTKEKSKGVGREAGGTAGAMAGAAYGATLGSVVPIFGTAIGGILGGLAGFFIGSEVGEAGGELVGEVIGDDEGEPKQAAEAEVLNKASDSLFPPLAGIQSVASAIPILGPAIMGLGLTGLSLNNSDEQSISPPENSVDSSFYKSPSLELPVISTLFPPLRGIVDFFSENKNKNKQSLGLSDSLSSDGKSLLSAVFPVAGTLIPAFSGISNALTMMSGQAGSNEQSLSKSLGGEKLSAESSLSLADKTSQVDNSLMSSNAPGGVVINIDAPITVQGAGQDSGSIAENIQAALKQHERDALSYARSAFYDIGAEYGQ